MLRVEHLSPTAQDVLRWLSCQTSVDHELLAEVTGLDADTLLDALREATASHILVARAEGTYAYRHALLREVVHDDLLPGERTRFHSVLARALEDRIEAGDTGAHITAQAAHHWMAAGDQSAAMAAAVRAGEAAERVDAYGEAHALFERALGLWERVDDPEALAGTGRRELLLRAAERGRPGRRDRPLRGARTERVRARRSRGRAALGGLGPDPPPPRPVGAQPSGRVGETLDRALALLEPHEDSGERAELLARKARARMLQSRNREAIAAGREALEVARSVGDRGAEILALNSIGVALAAAREVDEGIAALREALALVREHGLAEHIGRSYGEPGRRAPPRGAQPGGARGRPTGLEEVRADGRSGDWVALAVAEIECGPRATGAPRPRRCRRSGRRYWGSTLLNHRVRRIEQALGRGDVADARLDLDVAERVAVDSTEPQFLAPLAAYRPSWSAARATWRPRGAPSTRASTGWSSAPTTWPASPRWRSPGCAVEADEAQRARDRHDAEAERAARERAAAMAERVDLAAADGGPWWRPSGALARGRAGPRRGARRPAAVGAAAARLGRLGRPYRAAYSRWREAEALARARDREGAARRRGRGARGRPAARQRLARRASSRGWPRGPACSSRARRPRPPDADRGGATRSA